MEPHPLESAGGREGEPRDLHVALFTISAHISLVRTSLVAPRQSKRSGKCGGAEGMLSERSHPAGVISAGKFVS